MARPIKIIMPKFYPTNCATCPLCGIRPKDELLPGDKWTHICVVDDRILSGRGIRQSTARNRCGKSTYEKWYFSYQGNYLISPTRMVRYKMQEQKLIFNPDAQ